MVNGESPASATCESSIDQVWSKQSDFDVGRKNKRVNLSEGSRRVSLLSRVLIPGCFAFCGGSNRGGRYEAMALSNPLKRWFTVYCTSACFYRQLFRTATVCACDRTCSIRLNGLDPQDPPNALVKKTRACLLSKPLCFDEDFRRVIARHAAVRQVVLL